MVYSQSFLVHNEREQAIIKNNTKQTFRILIKEKRARQAAKIKK